jgi:two-component system sensor histidine kinase KdpD
VVALVSIALCTAIIYPLKQVAPVVSLSVVYLLAVFLVSAYWGLALGIATGVGSAAAFNYFHLPPVGQFTIRGSANWVALATFVVVAILASSLAEAARARAREAVERRREADLAAELARVLLRAERLDDAVLLAARRLTDRLELPSAAIELRSVPGNERRRAFPLQDGSTRLGTLLVPADLPEAKRRRLQERIVPALEALLIAALERETLRGQVVDTAALRQTDIAKTAVLRSVSHDLRTPLTAIAAAGDSIALPGLDAAQRDELAAVIREESTRLTRLVENLLDLSRLEAGAAKPRVDWCSLPEVLADAAAEVPGEGQLQLAIDDDLPLIRADAVQLERAFANVMENARRYSNGHPVSVRARAVGARILVRIVDRGPGIPPAERERVFEPFYEAGHGPDERRGSGLGLAITRGFVEANGGRVWVESLPGQGTSLVFEFPVVASEAGPAMAEPAVSPASP